MSNQQQQKQNNNSDLLRYAGLGAQIFVSLGIAVFAGYKADRWLHISFSLLIWLLPLLVLIGTFYKLLKETSKSNQADDQKKI
jgi:hypothetical protein